MWCFWCGLSVRSMCWIIQYKVVSVSRIQSKTFIFYASKFHIKVSINPNKFAHACDLWCYLYVVSRNWIAVRKIILNFSFLLNIALIKEKYCLEIINFQNIDKMYLKKKIISVNSIVYGFNFWKSLVLNF